MNAAELSALLDALNAAKARLDSERTPDTMSAYADAWNAHSAAYVALHGTRKTGGPLSRAARRQHAEFQANGSWNNQRRR